MDEKKVPIKEPTVLLWLTEKEILLLEELVRVEGDQGCAAGLEKVHERLAVARDYFEEKVAKR